MFVFAAMLRLPPNDPAPLKFTVPTVKFRIDWLNVSTSCPPDDERMAVPTCSHAHPSFRVTNGPRHILLCWECVLDEIQESKIDQPILIVRETD